MTDDAELLPDPREQRALFAERLEEAGVSTQRFIDVHDESKGTTNHTQRSPDDDRLRGNYGVYGGPGDGEEVTEETRWLVDVDVDDYADVDADATTDGLDSLPETFTVESPHTDGETGGHRYYAVIGDVANAFDERVGVKNPSPEWGEIRVSNQYCVGPGSQISPGGCVHDWCNPEECYGCDKEWCDECAKPDGGFYRIADDREIATLDRDTFVEAITTDLGGGDERDQPTGDDTPTSEGGTNDNDVSYTPDPSADAKAVIRANAWIADYLIGVESNPDRSKKDFAVCREFIKAGVSEDDAREVLDASKHTKVSRRGDGYWRETWTNAVEASIEDSHETETETGSEDLSNAWYEVKQFFDSGVNGSTTRGYGRAAELLDEDHDFVAIRETGELYYYDPAKGHYVRKGETFIAELLEQYIPGFVNSGRRKNIHETIQSRNFIDAEEFAPPEGKVCLQNGVLDLDNREIEPHSPRYYFTNTLPTRRDPTAEAPRWEQFLSESVGDTEARKLEEFIGYALEVWHHGREKNLFIVGPRQSGKSTFADTVQALFGSMPTVSNLTPQQIADTQFDAAALQEAALNTVNDINATKIEDSGTLKRVFSGERLKLERKFQDAVFGRSTAKHMFTANWLPTVIGQDESLYRRVLIVEFPNSLDDDEKDLDLKDDLKDELPGILERALDARDRLHEQGGFTNDRSTTETRRKWDSWLDAHKRFLYTQFHITGDSEDGVGKKTYYRAYKEYCGRKGYELKPQQAVTKALKWVPEIEVSEKSYSGLTWTPDDASDDSAGGRGREPESGLQTDLESPTERDPPQDELMTKLKRWIGEFESPVEGADMKAVYDYGESKGHDRDELSEKFEKLKDGGEVYNPQEGEWRRSD